MARILAAILNARARRGVAWRHEIPHVKRVLDTMQELKIKPHENELRFVRQLVDRGKFEHSWLPVDPNANLKRVRELGRCRRSIVVVADGSDCGIRCLVVGHDFWRLGSRKGKSSPV